MTEKLWGGSRGPLERTLSRMLQALEQSQGADLSARAAGFLQQFDPRVKLLGVFGLIAAVVISTRIEAILAVFLAAVLLARMSKLSWSRLGVAWTSGLIFTGVIALPAIVLVPGPALGHFPLTGWVVSERGVRSAVYLVARSEATLTLSVLLVFTTPWSHLLRALRALRVPTVLVVLTGMTYRYIFLLLETSQDMIQSRRSRIVGRIDAAERRRLMVASMGVLLGKTFQLSSEVHMAMQSRGYRGEAYILEEFRMSGRDWAALLGFGVASALTMWGANWGR
jgi:cobalt/nickel transport system permease protein